MRCKNCGYELKNDARFCTQCGAPVLGVTTQKRKRLFKPNLWAIVFVLCFALILTVLLMVAHNPLVTSAPGVASSTETGSSQASVSSNLEQATSSASSDIEIIEPSYENSRLKRYEDSHAFEKYYEVFDFISVDSNGNTNFTSRCIHATNGKWEYKCYQDQNLTGGTATLETAVDYETSASGIEHIKYLLIPQEKIAVDKTPDYASVSIVKASEVIVEFGEITINGTTYYCESVTYNFAEDDIESNIAKYCFDGDSDIIKYVLYDSDADGAIEGGKEIITPPTQEFDESILEIPDDYTIMSYVDYITESLQLINSGVLTVGVCADYPPFESISSDGYLTGFDIDLVQTIASHIGVGVNYVQVSAFDELLNKVGIDYDVVCSGVVASSERQKRFLLSDSYYTEQENGDTYQYVIVMPKGRNALQSRINEILNNMNSNGKMESLVQKWFE